MPTFTDPHITVEILHYDDPSSVVATEIEIRPFPVNQRDEAFRIALYAFADVDEKETMIWENDGKGNRGPLSGENLEAWRRYLLEHEGANIG